MKRKNKLSAAWRRFFGHPSGFRGVWQNTRRISQIIRRDRVFVYAGQAAMLILISLFPFIMLLFALAPYILPITQEELQQLFLSFTSEEETLSFLNGIAAELFHPPTISLISLTSLTALWSASRGVNAVRWGVRSMYRTPSKNNALLDVALSLLYTVMLFVMIILLLMLTVFGRFVMQLIERYSPSLAASLQWLLPFRFVILPIVLTFFFMLLYKFFADRKPSLWRQWPGALFAALGWVLFSAAFALYVNYFANYSVVYGSLTVVVILLLWLYALMAILLLGAEINAYLNDNNNQRRNDHGSDPLG